MPKWQDFDTAELMFNVSLLTNYRVKYYEFIVKRCSGVACSWWVLLDIALILALMLAVRAKYIGIVLA